MHDSHICFPDQDGVPVLTNHYAEPLQQHDHVSEPGSNEPSSFSRYAKLESELKALVAGQACDFALLDAIMTDPASPVCQFRPELEIETVWTLLLDLQRRKYPLIGNPRSGARAVMDFGMP